MAVNESVPPSENAAPNLWGWRTWVSLAVAYGAIGVMAYLSDVDFESVWRKFVEADKRWVLLGLLAHYLTYYFRGARWKYVLGHSPRRASRAKYGLMVFFYSFVDNMVPAKLGDLYAAHLARINLGVRRSAALGSLLFLRMIDGWIVLGLAAISAWIVFASEMPELVFYALVFGAAFAVVATVIMVLFGVMHHRMPAWVPERVTRMIRDIREKMVPSRKHAFRIVLFTVVIWVLEALWIYLLVYGFGLELTLVQVVFLTTIPLLASAVPLTPSGTGFVEMALFTCLTALPGVGVSKALAVSITVLNRAIDYWLHQFLGALTWGVRYRLGLYSWREREDEPSDSPTEGSG
ncbi:MAG: lysylphosphatidylglycerol synthase transmembrane domain-containing protein [Planctomycetota bacterium]